MDSEIKYTVDSGLLYKVPYAGKDIPHAVIEVNQKCNISCIACYKDKYDYTKPLEKIKEEIDLVMSKRNLNLITLAGGEPTLHAELPEVIKYISGKGILVDLLSNGFGLTDRKLAEYRKSGLNKIYVHIDAYQKRSDLKENSDKNELNELRTKISNNIIDHGLRCALEITLYKSNLAEFKEFVAYFLNNKMHQTLLITCCTDLEKIAIRHSITLPHPSPKNSLQDEAVLIDEVISYLYHQMKLLPYAYNPSTKSISEKRWIYYFSFVIHLKNGKSKWLHTNIAFKHFAKFGNTMNLKKTGKYPFDIIWNEKNTFYKCLLFAWLSLNLFTMVRTLFFLANLARPGSRLNYKSMIIQQLPNLADDGEIESCLNCPDITIKENKMIPVCLVDICK